MIEIVLNLPQWWQQEHHSGKNIEKIGRATKALQSFSSGFFEIIRAAITPGTQPASVSRKTITIEPHPLSITANGGNMIANITLKMLILYKFVHLT